MSVRAKKIRANAHSQSEPTVTPDANGLLWVPFNRLKDSRKNVREVPHTASHIKTLAALIDEYGQLYPLIVEPEYGEDGEPTGNYLVNAGKGRWLAHQLRVKQRKIPANEPIQCKLGTAENARGLSLADNVHAALHPADEFVAFKALVDEGKSMQAVADLFGVAPVLVRRRMKLANVAPEFIESYRAGSGITLEHLMALAVTDDQARQRSVWSEAAPGYRTPEMLRRALTSGEISTRSGLAQFVGEAYREAGGEIRQDLFSRDDEGFILDPDLLNRLARQKLEEEKKKIETEGFAWVEVRPQLRTDELSEFARVRTTVRTATAEEAQRLADLSTEQDQLDSEYEALDESDGTRAKEIEERLGEIDEEREEIEDACRTKDPAELALAGAILRIDAGGQLRIERGLLKPEDRQKVASERKAAQAESSASGNGKGESADDAEGEDTVNGLTHSAALLRSLTAHRALALQAAVAARPDVALVALTQRLLTLAFYRFDQKSALAVSFETEALSAHASDLVDSKAYAAMQKCEEEVRAQLPEEESLFSWLLAQPQETVLRLLAFCVAKSVHGVSGTESTTDSDELAKAVRLDMRDFWTVSASNYFARVPKHQIEKVVCEATSPEVSSALRLLKKADAATAAAERIAGKGWLPPVLRTASV